MVASRQQQKWWPPNNNKNTLFKELSFQLNKITFIQTTSKYLIIVVKMKVFPVLCQKLRAIENYVRLPLRS